MKKFGQLPAAVLCRIRMSARYRCRGTGKDADELVHEAIERLCRTSPPLEVTLPVLMHHTMRSIAHSWRTSARQKPDTFRYDDEKHSLTVSTEQEVEEFEEERWREARDQDAIERLRNYFLGDRNVSAILTGIIDEKSASEIRDGAQMTQAAYDSAHRRMRRGLDKLFPERRNPKK